MSGRVETRLHAGVPEALARQLATWRSPAGVEAVAVPWSRLVAQANPGRVSLHAIEVRREGAVEAIGLVHVVHGLAIGDYAGGALETITRLGRRVGRTPLAFDVGYVELPHFNRPGIFTAPEIDAPARAQAWRAIVDAADRGLRVDALCVKTSSRDPVGMRALEGTGLAFLPFTENYLVTLPGEPPSAETWLAQLGASRRRHVRVSRRRFEDAGGSFETVRDPAPIADELEALFERTVARARARGDLPLPMAAGAALYRELHTQLGDAACVRVARIGDDIVGFTLQLRTADALFMRFVGLDYERSHASGAYFASYSDMCETAASEGRRFVDLGSGTGEVKRRVGAERWDVHYRVAFRRWLAPARGLLTRMLASRFGTGAESPPDELIPS